MYDASRFAKNPHPFVHIINEIHENHKYQTITSLCLGYNHESFAWDIIEAWCEYVSELQQVSDNLPELGSLLPEREKVVYTRMKREKFLT